jgi:hypothetical protein
VFHLFNEDFNTYVETKLNLNTKGLTFKVGFFFKMEKDKFVIKTQNNYTIDETNYIPCMIQDWRNTSQPYDEVDMQDFVLPLSVAIPQTKLDDGLAALDEFRTLLNGADDTIGSYKLGLRIGQPSPPSNPIAHGGEYLILVDLIIMLGAAKDVIYGNAVEFKMAKHGETLQTMVLMLGDIATTTTVTTSQNTYITTAKNGKSLMTSTVNIVHQPSKTMSSTLLDEMWQATSPNQTYDISFKYSATITKTAEVIITNIGQHIEKGVVIGYSITYLKA